MERAVPFFNKCISFVAFTTILSLVVYMLISFVTGLMDVGVLMFDTVFLEPAERQSIFNALNSEFLHNVAVLLILMKAYRILVDYMRYHHVDVKFMVEIGIIAGVLELLFNSSEYTDRMQVILAAMTISFLFIYVFKYENLVRAMKESQTSMVDTIDLKGLKSTILHSGGKPTKATTKKVAKKATKKAAKKTVKKVVKKAVKKTTKAVQKKA